MARKTGLGVGTRACSVGASLLARSGERTLSLPSLFFCQGSESFAARLLRPLSVSEFRKAQRWLERVRMLRAFPGPKSEEKRERERAWKGMTPVTTLLPLPSLFFFSRPSEGAAGASHFLSPDSKKLFRPSNQLSLSLSLSKKKKNKISHARKQPAPRPRSTRPTTAPTAPRRSGPARRSGSAPSCCTRRRT